MKKNPQLLIDREGAGENTKLLTAETSLESNTAKENAILSIMGIGNKMKPFAIHKSLIERYEIRVKKLSELLGLFNSLCEKGFLRKTSGNGYIVNS